VNLSSRFSSGYLLTKGPFFKAACSMIWLYRYIYTAKSHPWNLRHIHDCAHLLTLLLLVRLFLHRSFLEMAEEKTGLKSCRHVCGASLRVLSFLSSECAEIVVFDPQSWHVVLSHVLFSFLTLLLCSALHEIWTNSMKWRCGISFYFNICLFCDLIWP
jgi:hypothetical protein